MKDLYNIVVVGGGASGFFAAIEAASSLEGKADIAILESSNAFLSKVRISGGGRCNVTHNQFEPKIFAKNYPRGSKELLSPFQKFQALDTVNWFKDRGIKVVAEEDGRMFPSTNKSETIIECFLKEAQKYKVDLLTRHSVESIKFLNGFFEIKIRNQKSIQSKSILIATGSSKKGYELSKSLGHTITELAPSLFSFKIKHPLLTDLAGTSFENVELAFKAAGKKFNQSGPMLITHRGLSGPAILKLSAWAARELKKDQYKTNLKINWSGLESRQEVEKSYLELKSKAKNTQIKNASPDFFTKNFWRGLVEYVGITEDKKWIEISKKEFNKIIEESYASILDVDGQNRFKDEFVECGGVKLSEVDFKTMESKLVKGLFFSGELLDIDGVTGGFNFQNAWTTGYLAGQAMAEQQRQI